MIRLMVKRNLRIFFRDKASVFFSLFGVIIIIGLYVLFLGDLISGDIAQIPQIGSKARFLMDSWIMGGVIAAASITTCMGAFGIMIDDTQKKIIKDFQVSPFERSKLVFSYILSAVVIGIIMSLFTLVLAEIYIVMFGGELLSLTAFLKVIGLTVFSVCASSAIIFFVTTFIKSQNAFGTASTVLGTLIGFITGIYIPIGQLPGGVQTVIKIFPVSHAAVLLRQAMMNVAVDIEMLPDNLKF
ncbi:MAG: ABC transporter permease, partial [Bacilli bacterium]|nr:ABC transporter permease [Bacilli bacterium]